MAVEKVYKCDLCGTAVPRSELVVARVGTPDDRPEDCERIDLGPECASRPIAGLIAKYKEMVSGG